MAKGKVYTKQVKQKASQKPQGHKSGGQPKHGQKRLASNGSDNSEADAEPRARTWKKSRNVDIDTNEVEEVEKEENEEEVEQIADRGNDDAQSEDSSDLEDQHRSEIPAPLAVKSDTTKDLLTVFSDLVTVNFKKGDTMTNKKGANKGLLKGGEKRAFFTGGNSSCQAHIRGHYEIYKEQYKDGNIPENHHTLPWDIYRQMKLNKKATRAVQLTLDGVLEKLPDAKIYTRDGMTHAIAQFVACDDQTTQKDLPSRHDIEVYIHNEFVDWLKMLKTDIMKALDGISSTADGWTADNTKVLFLGMTVSWIEVKGGKWKLRSEVVGFQPVSGDHSGWNLGQYLVGLCDHVRIFNKNGSKLFTITLNNTSNNNTTCKAIETFHTRRQYDNWDAKDNQLLCFGHVINIANIAVMGCITKIAAVENANAIWEYDSSLPNNRILEGSLDVIAAIQTIAVKIQASGQCIEYFEKLQLQSTFNEGQPSACLNARTSYESRSTCSSTRPTPCLAPFNEKDPMDSNDIQKLFSSEQQPTLWRALPALEELQTAWKDKQKLEHFALYRKYYSRIDTKPVFILALGSERLEGNPYAKNWQDEALKVVEKRKQTVDLRRLSLGVKHFEELQIMKFAWRKNIHDTAEQNWAWVEEVEIEEYSEILDADKTSAKWDQQLLDADKFILEDSD
ncbi:hypothetical protein BGY98DRAFT_937844 [Russula aff. rugulosa BPL654]|nr:hypothetical protein BGY98DRAFT_937844 [Russula aff. rugulosa BPL654]